RTETRAWLAESCPEEMRDGDITAENQCWGGRQWKFQSEAQKRWFDAAVAKGYTVPTWPREYGGAGLTVDEAKILAEELRRINALKQLNNFCISMLKHAMLAFNKHEKKQMHLTAIAREEIH